MVVGHVPRHYYRPYSGLKLAGALQKLYAVNTRHYNVGQQKIDGIISQHFKRSFTIAHVNDIKAFVFENASENLSSVLVVVGQ
jgi:hypothetical protein